MMTRSTPADAVSGARRSCGWKAPHERTNRGDRPVPFRTPLRSGNSGPEGVGMRGSRALLASPVAVLAATYVGYPLLVTAVARRRRSRQVVEAAADGMTTT